MPLPEDPQAAHQLLADWPAHLQLNRSHLLIHPLNAGPHLLVPMHYLFRLEAAALDEAVGERLKQAKVNLGSRGALYQFIAFAESLKGLCELPQILIDQPYLGALLEFVEH